MLSGFRPGFRLETLGSVVTLLGSADSSLDRMRVQKTRSVVRWPVVLAEGIGLLANLHPESEPMCEANSVSPVDAPSLPRARREMFSAFLLIVLLAAMAGKFALERRLEGYNRTLHVAPLTVVRRIFPEAAGVSPRHSGKGYDVTDTVGNVIGHVMHSESSGKTFTGYGGPIHLLIGISADGTVSGLALLPNRESSSFIEYLEEEGLFDVWTGKPVSVAADLPVDAISGATLSSRAIIRTVKATLSVSSEPERKIPVREWLIPVSWREWVAWSGLLTGLLIFTRRFLTGRLRWPGRLAVVVMVGFIGGTSLSSAVLAGWCREGLPTDLFTPVLITAVLSAAIALVSGRNFYCTSLCPFGAFQELAAHLPWIRRIRVPAALGRCLLWLRGWVLAALFLSVFAGILGDLTYVEPFAAFQFRVCPREVLGLALLLLLLSAFIPRFWCRYVCPTGYFLECLRGQSVNDHRRSSRERVLTLILIAMLAIELVSFYRAGVTSATTGRFPMEEISPGGPKGGDGRLPRNSSPAGNTWPDWSGGEDSEGG